MCRHNRENYGTVDIVYGSRSQGGSGGSTEEILDEWMRRKNDVDVYLTIDRAQEGWDGHVGFVPTYVKELGFDTEQDGAGLRPAHHD